ncbi:hypothetical protein [Jiangella alkaliphila]|uniref:Uncharacterized protein n=1 Tax=Jiangella alkaliphila TaxID=419479 RepID=A0A1H2I9M5_9ACTN|nr:hypothetical protein [Jiangella alkaliphila]SDU40695.1 hypothetical protein SAMN04488563_1534 [Jiangella alkaliphila]
MTTTDERQASFRDLFGAARAMTSLVLAGGIALHAVNIFLTTSLLPTAIDDIGGERWRRSSLVRSSPPSARR